MAAATAQATEARPSDASFPTPRVSAQGFDVGDFVWSPCARTGFRRSTIVSIDAQSDSFFVESRDQQDPGSGGQFPVRRSEVRPFYDSGPERTFEDNTSLVHLDDANILDNLRRRFQREEIYTFTSNVLLAVNPYKQLPHLYTAEKRASYRGKNAGQLPPHPYAIADTAYRHLLRERRDQALVISGESGAGKTETAKITMNYLTQMSRTDAAHGGRIQDKIMNANPILESFGNASTVRNMNSSRFGKYNEMCFNPVGSLVGANIKTYLLESSRVVCQQEGERNYHVFYQVLAGLDTEILDQLQLDPTTRYRLLSVGGATPLQEDSPERRRFAQEFADLRKALSTFVNSDVEQDIWDVIGALIHLGEVEFEEVGVAAPDAAEAEVDGAATAADGAEGVVAQEPRVKVVRGGQDALAQAADLLGLSQCRLEQVLMWREMHVKRQQNRRTSHIQCPRSKAQASQTLQSIIKILYKRLFDKIVEKINESSAGPFSSARRGTPDQEAAPGECTFNSIGTLDIYGFERLQTNSFEQLCINLANERLQQFFIEEVLEAEQRTYAEESLNICKIQLPNSQPVVMGIQGVMAVLDEHSLRAVKNLCSGEDKDVRFCEHVHREHIRDPKSNGPVMALKLKASRSGHSLALHDGFQIRHYAGDVSYSTRGWIDKNNDALVPEVETLLADGTKPLVRSMSDAKGADPLAGERLHSVSKDYLGNLDHLLSTLKSCSVHYIRCFNPNQNRSAAIFDTKYVLEQVIQCGTVELVEIMHHGYPHRCFLQDLRKRFTNLLPEDFSRYSDRDYVLAIMLAFEIDENQWTLGTKRLFLKAGQLRTLENLRDVGSTASKDTIRKIRMLFARKKVRAWGRVICIMKWWPRHMKQRRQLVLIQGLKKATYVFVRLHRWLASVRVKLYGLPPVSDRPHVDLAMYQYGLTYTLPGKELGLRSTGRGSPQLFIALNSYEEPQYTNFLQNNIDHRKGVQEDVLKIWQKNTTESVLFFDGRSIVSARLSPKAFLGQSGPRLEAHEADAAYGRSLEDVRQVDVHDSGRAVPLADGRWEGDITCMCQHRREKQTFATCDAESQVLIWKWLGTDPNEPEKAATKPLGGFRLEDRNAVFQMCFLSEVPARVAERSGLVLLTLSVEPGRHWLNISIVSVYQGTHQIEHMMPVGVYSDLLPDLRKTGVQVSIFTTSHSNSILILGGPGLLQFYAIQVSAQGEFNLKLIEDAAQSYPDIKLSSMISCLSLPLPGNVGAIDWIVVGDRLGKLYGFRFDRMEDGVIHVNQQACGRFRSNSHAEGTPIRSLIATYGATPSAHHKGVQQRGVSYSLYLNTVPLDAKGFYSMADDGKLLTWQLVDKTGWTATNETSIRSIPCTPMHGWQPEPSRDTCQFVAGHASRLVPQIIVIVDQDRKLFMCYDRTRPDELPTEAMCSYA